MTNPTFGIPSPILPATDPQSGKLASVWYQFLTRLAQLTPESPFSLQTIGPSPWSYKASTIGNLFVSGGTVSQIVLTRSGFNIILSTSSGQFIPLAAGDTVTITYSVAPAAVFIPSARA